MRRWFLVPVALALVVLSALWVSGGFDALASWAAEGQQRFQRAMAGALRALKGGEPGAVATLIGLCFAYGFFHAVGPGHGKVLIGGYGVGRRVPVGRLVGLALASSLAQSLTAIGLVYAGVLVFEWSRSQMTDLADGALNAFSYAAIGLIGVWLLWRGVRGLWRLRTTDAAEHGHDHSHDHGHGHGHGHTHEHGEDVCQSCGHAHGPTPDQAAQVRSLRDALLLIGGIAIRPCTGALFVLILTWRMGIEVAGIAGALAMGLGTASVTVAVAIGAVMLREGTLQAVSGSGRGLRVLVPTLEMTAGLLVAIISMQLLMRSL